MPGLSSAAHGLELRSRNSAGGPAGRHFRLSPATAPDAALAGVCAATLGAALAGFATGEPLPNGPVLCPFRLATGVPCPFCGLTRSVVSAGQGRLVLSLDFHVLGPAMLALAAVLLPLSVAAVVSGKPIGWRKPVLAAGSVALLAGWALNLALGGP